MATERLAASKIHDTAVILAKEERIQQVKIDDRHAVGSSGCQAPGQEQKLECPEEREARPNLISEVVQHIEKAKDEPKNNPLAVVIFGEFSML